jgi:uncharacterized membrane protein
MKPIFSFIRTTIAGGILFLLPVVLIGIILARAYIILNRFSSPLSRRLPNDILGFDGHILISLLLLVLVCFLSGLMFKTQIVKRWIKTLEDKVLVFLPGYTLMKSLTTDTIGDSKEATLKPALIKEGEFWGLGFLVEEGDNLSTVFRPDAPRHDAGEIRLVPKESVRKLNVPLNVFSKSIRNYGKGAQTWFEE